MILLLPLDHMCDRLLNFQFYLVELLIMGYGRNQVVGIVMSAPNSNENVADTGSAEPAEPMKPGVDVDQPNAPAPPADTSQTFKCEKCGATFTDAGSAAVHIQTCKGLEEPTTDIEKDGGNQKPIPQPSPSGTPSPIA